MKNKKINSLVVWAFGTYPVEREDYDIEMSLFMPLNSDERDSETQAIFEKDNFFSVGGKIVPRFYNGNKRAKMIVSTSTHVTILNKVVESNKCPLKISLVEIPQELPNEIKDNTIIKMLVSDFSGQEYNFIMRVVFLCHNSWLMRLKDMIHPQESLIFIVGQLEIIENEFYIYAKDGNYVDTHFSNKKKFFDGNVSQGSSTLKNSIRSKLLNTHQNIIGDSEVKLPNTTLDDSKDFEDSSDLNFVGSHSVKRARVDASERSFDKSLSNIDHESYANTDDCSVEDDQEVVEGSVKNNKDKKNNLRSKGKEPVERSLHSNSGLYGST
ncbi:hypothetical protein F8M41_000152 [Gigaspora margarita]|uniref:Uncharacterized protein n=1 Tax=Gigaspora margarita TaxID=4874 RepID=A0A8H4ESS6_GIGMA|nr:hypothetical protein F8M41_000152 [Gigaspora margarita]